MRYKLLESFSEINNLNDFLLEGWEIVSEDEGSGIIVLERGE